MTWLAASVGVGVLLIGTWLWLRLKAWDAPLLVGLCGVALWAAIVFAMGRARPIRHDFFNDFGKLKIIAYVLRQDDAIYLWVDEGQPIAYRVPWDMKTARRLHEAGKKAKKGRHKLIGKRRHDGQFVFHPEPIEPPPPKE